MGAGASGGADIEGRAFDAGPEAQNESAASIGESAGLSGQAAKDYGIAQMDALDAQHGTNFGQRARGLTGNNSIGTAELDSFGFDADAPAGLQHAHQQAALEQALYDPSTMMAQNALQSLSWDFMQNPLGIIDPDEVGIAHPSTETGYSPTFGYFKYGGQHVGKHDTGLLGLGKTIQVGMRDRPLYGPHANPVAVYGYDPGLGPHYEGPVREVDFRDDFGSTSSGVLSQGGIPTSNYGMGMGGGPDAANMSLDDFGITEGLDEALATNLYSFPKQYLDYPVDIDDFNPNLEFNTTIPNPAFDPDNIRNNPQDAWDAIDNLFGPAINLSNLDNAVFNYDNAMVSTEDNPWGYNQSVIDGLNASFDTGAVSRAGGGEPLAQRVAETMIAQQAARQVTPESNKVTIPTSSGPDIVIDVTPPAPQTHLAPHRRTAPPPSPVKIAAKSVAKPKAFKKLPKFAQKEIRQGKVPTSGSDNVQDMVRAFLGGQESFGDSGTRK